MAKRTSTTYLTPGEQVAGAVLFVIYLLVLPFATGPLFRLVEALLGTQLSPALENILYYYILFAVTVIVFHGFLGRTTRVLVDRLFRRVLGMDGAELGEEFITENHAIMMYNPMLEETAP